MVESRQVGIKINRNEEAGKEVMNESDGVLGLFDQQADTVSFRI